VARTYITGTSLQVWANLGVGFGAGNRKSDNMSGPETEVQSGQSKDEGIERPKNDDDN
jgi:hypothetical protein